MTKDTVSKKKAAKKKSLPKSIGSIMGKPSTKLARFAIKSIQTAVPEIVISFAFRKTDMKASAFIKPMIDYFDSHFEAGGTVASEWMIYTFNPRRESGTDKAMKTGPNGAYDWDSMVTIKTDEQVSARDIGENIALHFSHFGTELYKRQKFDFDSVIDDQKPVNHYLLDDDCVSLLRLIYSTSSREDLEKDDEVMSDFFGSPEAGKLVLQNYSDTKWNLAGSAISKGQ